MAGGSPTGRLAAFPARDRRPMEVVHTAPEAVAQVTAPGGVGGGESGSQTFDVVVIGGGPGGYAAALYGASAGLSIAIVEQEKVGGTCLHRGCIPAKEFLETAAVYRTVSGSAEFGIRASADPSGPVVEFAVSQKRKQQVVEQLYNGLAGLLKGRKVTTFDGTGVLLPGRRVRVTGGDGSTTEIAGTHVVLAAGSVPRTIPGFEIDGRLVVTSDEFLSLEELPSTAAIIGGGVIGCEFASLSLRPRHRGDHLRGAAVTAARMRRRPDQGGGAVVPATGHRRQGRRDVAGPRSAARRWGNRPLL